MGVMPVCMSDSILTVTLLNVFIIIVQGKSVEYSLLIVFSHFLFYSLVRVLVEGES